MDGGDPRVGRLPGIDVLRGVAILMVLWNHLGAGYLFKGVQNPLSGVWHGTWTGVQLFFVISGYVISRSLAPDLQKEGRARAVGAFYFRRFTRLFPVFVVWLAIAWPAAGAAGYAGPSDYSTWRELLACFFSFENFYMLSGHTARFNWHWSLSIEEQFCFVFPALLLLLRTRWSRLLFLASFVLLTAVVFVPHFAAVYGGMLALAEKESAAGFACIFSGAILYFLAPASRPPRAGSLSASLPNVLAIAVLIATPHWLNDSVALDLAAVTALSAGLVYRATTDARSFFFGTRIDAVLRAIGLRSYVLYLAHIPAFWATRILSSFLPGDGLSPGSRIVVYLLILGASTEVTHRLVELPLIRWGKGAAVRFRSGEGAFRARDWGVR